MIFANRECSRVCRQRRYGRIPEVAVGFTGGAAPPALIFLLVEVVLVVTVYVVERPCVGRRSRVEGEGHLEDAVQRF